MIPIVLVGVLAGTVLLRSSVRGVSPMETVRAALTGGRPPTPRPKPNPNIDPTTGGVKGGNYGPPAPVGTPPAVPSNSASPLPTARPTPGPVVVPGRGSKNFGVSAGSGDQGDALVWLGIGNHRLQPAAANSWSRAGARVGHTITITDSYRTHAEQVKLKAEKPDLAATPGHSLHERGLALDLPPVERTPEVAEALTAEGWHQFNAEKEPWHWSYGRTG